MTKKVKDKAVKKKRPGLAPVKNIFTTPANPATWEPTPLQLEVYLNICRGTAPWKEAIRLKTTTVVLQAMCDAIDDYLVARDISDIRTMRRRMATRLECLFYKASEAFERSMQPAKTTESGKSVNGDFHKERVAEQAAGNPAFLGIVRDCLVDLRALWAMDKRTADEVADREEFRVTGGTRHDALKAELVRLTVAIQHEEQQAKGG